jgi:hypothetical protein
MQVLFSTLTLDISLFREKHLNLTITKWLQLMDANAREELHATVEKLTHSGNPSLDMDLVKKIKGMCRYGGCVVS